MKAILRELGFSNADVLEPFDSIGFPGGEITILPFPGEHVDLEIYTRQCFLVKAQSRQFAFFVDSDGWDPGLFRRMARRIHGRIDALFIGMESHGAPLTWLYGPLMTHAISRRDDESRRLSGFDCRRAWEAMRELSVDKVFVYAMGQEPWLRYLMGLEYSPDSVQLKEVASFLGRCEEARIPAENLYMSRELVY
jgi:hypothetical protein